MDTIGALLNDLPGEQEYANASVEFRKARSSYLRARSRLVAAIENVGHDRDGMLQQSEPDRFYPVVVERRRDHWSLRHKVPLPATLPQIKLKMGWTTEKAHEWLKRQQAAGYVVHQGERRHYVYHYTEKYEEKVGLLADAGGSGTPYGTSGDSSLDELSRIQHAETSCS